MNKPEKWLNRPKLDPNIKIYDPKPYDTAEELDAIERARKVNYFNTFAKDKYIIKKTNHETRVEISNFDPDNNTLIMTNTKTKDTQIIDFTKFRNLLKSGYLKIEK